MILDLMPVLSLFTNYDEIIRKVKQLREVVC